MPSRLFSPLSLRSMQLDNRIVVSPLAQFMADSEGNATDWHIMHLGNLALSGASLLMIEATAVEQRGCNTRDYLCLWTDAHERSLKRVVDFCRSISPVRLGIQLHHCGRKGSVVKPWEGLQQIPLAEGGWATIVTTNNDPALAHELADQSERPRHVRPPVEGRDPQGIATAPNGRTVERSSSVNKIRSTLARASGDKSQSANASLSPQTPPKSVYKGQIQKLNTAAQKEGQ